MEINKHIIFYPLDSKFIKKCTTSAGVYMIRNLVAEYDSIAEAARSINKGYSCIRDACKKRQLSAYGFLWEYKNEEDKKKVLKERRGKWKSIVR